MGFLGLDVKGQLPARHLDHIKRIVLDLYSVRIHVNVASIRAGIIRFQRDRSFVIAHKHALPAACKGILSDQVLTRYAQHRDNKHSAREIPVLCFHDKWYLVICDWLMVDGGW